MHWLLHLRDHLEKFYALSYKTGATKADSWIDIEGGIGNLFSYASLRRKFADEIFAVDGEGINLSKNNTFMGHHILVPKEGVAITYQCIQFSGVGNVGKSCGELAGRCSCHCKTCNGYMLFN